MICDVSLGHQSLRSPEIAQSIFSSRILQSIAAREISFDIEEIMAIGKRERRKSGRDRRTLVLPRNWTSRSRASANDSSRTFRGSARVEDNAAASVGTSQGTGNCGFTRHFVQSLYTPCTTEGTSCSAPRGKDDARAVGPLSLSPPLSRHSIPLLLAT